MNLKKWELSHYPSETDKNRWRLKLKIDVSDLASLLASLPFKMSRPFVLSEDEYDYGVYLGEATDEQLQTLQDAIGKNCREGAVVHRNAGSLDSLMNKMISGIESGIAPSSGNGAEAPVKPGRNDTPSPPPSPEFRDLDLNPRYTFQEFIIGPNNRFTAAAAQAVADNLGKIYNPFFIYGGVGLGKTHLMHAVGHAVRSKNPQLHVLYLTTEKFMGDVIDSIRRGTLQSMREHYRTADLLLVDDIQFLMESESTQEEFFHTFNILHQNGKQIIITSDRPPKQLVTLEDRLRSRFEWGLIADIKSPNLETRVAILKKKGEMEHLKLDDNILLFIASKLKSNIRELEGFLKRINAYATLTHQEVNMDLVKTLMSDLLPAEEMEDVPREAAPPAAAAPRTTPQAPPSSPPPYGAFPQAPQSAPNAFSHPPPVSPAPPAPAAPQAPSYGTYAPSPQPSAAPVRKPPEAPRSAPLPLKPQPSPAAPGTDASEAGLKPVEVGFFYPQGKDLELTKVKERFREVIKKHKLKFRLEGVFERSYTYAEKIDYAVFPVLCKTNNVAIAVVLGPPPETVSGEDFGNLLATVMDDAALSLQLVQWPELNKDYRYLNLALDITLLKHQG